MKYFTRCHSSRLWDSLKCEHMYVIGFNTVNQIIKSRWSTSYSLNKSILESGYSKEINPKIFWGFVKCKRCQVKTWLRFTSQLKVPTSIISLEYFMYVLVKYLHIWHDNTQWLSMYGQYEENLEHEWKVVERTHWKMSSFHWNHWKPRKGSEW